MKINLGKIARVLGRLAVAAPAVIVAAKPVFDALRTPSQPRQMSSRDVGARAVR